MNVRVFTRGDQGSFISGQVAGAKQERDRIVEIIQAGQWAGESLQEDISNLVALIRDKK